jgi:hypothetical protein
MRDDLAEETAWQCAKVRLGLRGRKEDRKHEALLTSGASEAPALGPDNRNPLPSRDLIETGPARQSSAGNPVGKRGGR